MKPISLALLLLLLVSPAFATAAEWDGWCSNQEQFDKLKTFAQNMRQIQSKKEKNGISAEEIEALLGAPNDKHDKSIKIQGGEEVWHYWDPCAASVRYLLVFNGSRRLMLMTAVQQLIPGDDVYYDIEQFLPS